MRSTRCKDGKRRILTKIEVPMDIEDIAGFAWTAVIHDEVNKEWESRSNPAEKLKGMNKREILRLAKKTVKKDGTAEPHEYPAEVLQHVKKCFPEVD
jgi:hypothetical protein